MSRVILRLHWLLLKRDRPALVMAFIVPIVFFSMFSAMYFEVAGDRAPRVLKIAILDLDRSELSRRLVSGLQQEAELEVLEIAADQRPEEGARNRVLQLVRAGSIPVGVILAAGFGERLQLLEAEPAAVQILEDRSDAPRVAIFKAVFDAVIARLAAQAWAARALETLQQSPPGPAAVFPSREQIAASLPAAGARVGVEHVDVLGSASGGYKSAAIAYFAAGTGVLFLLFTMAGAAATLLDEVRDGTLQRLLASGLGIGRLLLYKWLFFAILGSAQVFLMFAWGWAVFGLDLFTIAHFTGFLAMTLLTSLASAALGIALATASGSRAQFTAFSTILILVMSALGGSMFPRFLMSDTLKAIGLVTFNAWALDGYQKVFWYEGTLTQLWPQMAVLAVVAVLLMALARLLAARWTAQ